MGIPKSSFSANVHQQTSCPPNAGPFPSALMDRSNVLPIQKVPGEKFGPIKVYNPFFLQDLRQIKTDLGKFSENPDKYIDVFQKTMPGV